MSSASSAMTIYRQGWGTSGARLQGDKVHGFAEAVKTNFVPEKTHRSGGPLSKTISGVIDL